QTVPLTGISSGAPNESQTLAVAAVSSNTGLVPTPTVAYTSPNSTGTLNFTPVPTATGAATITVTVDDGSGSGNATFARSFTVTVTAPNKPPTISSIPDQTIQKNNSTHPIPFTIGDAETPAQSLVLSASSSSSNLVAASQIVFGGSGSNRTVTTSP